jgi:hypothetical protein
MAEAARHRKPGAYTRAAAAASRAESMLGSVVHVLKASGYDVG